MKKQVTCPHCGQECITNTTGQFFACIHCVYWDEEGFEVTRFAIHIPKPVIGEEPICP